MKPELKKNGRRVTAGFLAFAMITVLALGDAGAAFASESVRALQRLTGSGGSDGVEEATASDAKIRERRTDVVLNVHADEDSEFQAGGTVSLDVRIKNNTDGVVDGGVLTLWANGIVEDSIQMELPENTEDGDDAEIIDGFVLTNDLNGEAGNEISYATPSDMERWSEEEDVVSRTLEGIHLNPGQVYAFHLYFDIDDEIEGKRVQNVKLRFQGMGESKKIRVEDSFDYTVNGMNLDEVAFADDGRAKPGSTVTMGIHAEVFDEHVYVEEAPETLEEMLEATPSNAKRAATPSNAQLTATSSNAEKEEIGDSTVELQAAGASYEIDLHNLELKNFEVEKALASGDEEKLLVCSFEIPEKTAPGVYFGKVTQKFTKDSFTSRSTRGFVLVVEPDGEVILESRLGDELVTVSGPAEAFPQADQLAVKVSEPGEEQKALAEEAMQKLADAGEDISGYRAVDIKLYADGVEAEPEGSVQVTFSNMFRDDGVFLAAEDEAAETGTEDETEIRIFHLDEETGTANEVTSETQANGNVVMETDHFSTWIGVRSPKQQVADISGVYGYVSKLELTEVLDGTAPMDANDDPGNDSGYDNGIVRSFDDISYELAVSMHPVSGGPENSYSSGMLYLEAELPMDITKAKFDLNQMKWLENYTITYYDENGEELAKGTNAEPNYKANSKASGSDQGTQSYRTQVEKQVLSGSYTLAGETPGAVVIPGTKSLSIGIHVLAAANGDHVEPSFKVWVGENTENFGVLSSSGVGSDPKDFSIDPEPTIVSAAARYNIQLKKTTQMNYLGNFDLKTGQEVASPNNDSLHGRLVGYGVTLQLYNQLTPQQGSSAKVNDKKLKGVELPQGPIEFDFTVKEAIYDENKKDVTQEKGYTPMLWDYNPNMSRDTGTWGRNMRWGGVSSTNNAFWQAPYNQYSGTYSPSSRACYGGGSWTVLERDGYHYKETEAGTIEGTERTYRIQVENYDFDLEKFIFPNANAGNTSEDTRYTSYIGCFSTGYLEVLVQYPEDIADTMTLNLSAEVNPKDNWSVSSLSPKEEISKETHKGDNKLSGAIELYEPGSMVKYNSFTKKGGTSFDNKFLGTSYWGKVAYDASCYAGDEIWLWGSYRYDLGGDDHITAVNLLQKFDSSALEIVGEPKYSGRGSTATEDLRGKIKFLYAADEDYPNGWDSNKTGMMSYMNQAQEEDLKYYESLDALRADDKTCVAVLLEARDVDLTADGYIQFYVPVKVTQDKEHVGKTVCTVNTARAWNRNMPKMTHSWASNSAEGYVETRHNPASDYSKGYVKSEFKDGVLVTDTHKGGIHYGMSLLILGYESHVTISSGQKTYDLDKGERTASFTISQIGTDTVSANAGQTGSDQEQRTDLTVTATIETENTKGKKSLSFLSGTYQMCGWLEGEEGGVVLEKNPVSIPVAGSESDVQYTPVTYTDRSTGKQYTIQVGGWYQGDKILFYIKDVAVGTPLPNITFDAAIGNPGYEDDAENNQEIPVSAAISGTSDIRAYDETAGNLSTISVSVVRLSASGVIKMVNKRVVEMNEEFTYTIEYRNLGKTDLNNIYMYDILPYNHDFRNSAFDGTITVKSIQIDLGQPDPEDGSIAGNTAEAELYLSKTDSKELGDKESGKDNGLWADFNTIFNIKAGSTSQGKLEYSVTEKDPVTAVGLLIQRLPAGKTISVEILIKPEGNKAADSYINTARTWFSTSSDAPDYESALMTNRVQTVVVSRGVSGRVWHDLNWNGLYDEGEETLQGIEVTLQKKENNGYASCTNVLGNPINPVTTDSEGRYAFTDLASGDYRVVFGGTVLDSYIGETVYQADSTYTSRDSDGTALDDKTYRYRISRTEGNPDISYKPADEMDVNMPYDNVEHMDLGLLKGAKLQLKKMVDNKEQLDNEPVTSPYKFLIRLMDADTGEEYTAVALQHEETSGVIEIRDFWKNDAKDSMSGRRRFTVTEIVPMEYTMTGMESELESYDDRIGDMSEKIRLNGTENGSVVTVYPGDHILITLTNTPDHSGYFHRTASVTNVKAHDSDSFQADSPYKEPHGKNGSGIPSGTQLFSAVVKEKDEDMERRLEKGDDLYG